MPPLQDPLLDVGGRLRAAREARGLSLRQLAINTRVSTAVLEALEKGWSDRLPEPTYLRAMLKLLEQHLQLQPGALQGALPTGRSRGLEGRGERGQGLALPMAIELLGSWQGSLAYGILCLALIYGINRQQQHLASLGLLTLRPIPPQASAAAAKPQDRDSARILVAFPDLRPLEQARRGQALSLLQRRERPVTGRTAGSPTSPAAPAASSRVPGRPAQAPSARPDGGPATRGQATPMPSAPGQAGEAPSGATQPSQQTGGPAAATPAGLDQAPLPRP